MLRICSIGVLLAGSIWSAPVRADQMAVDITGPIAVIDADTLRVNGRVIRLHGIDAPEHRQSCTTEQGVRWACGIFVTQRVRASFQGATARCAPITQDRYGRVVAKCFVGDVDIGRWLVQEGYAFAYRKYALDYDLDEKRAAITNRGLHGSHVQSPAQFRKTRATGRIPLDPACRIKGNIAADGERIFHVPGQEHYEVTGIRPERGERWFCDPQEARAAGWRAAKR